MEGELGNRIQAGLVYVQLAVFESDFPSEIAQLLSEMQDERLVADYDMSKETEDWQEDEASFAIDQAIRFVDEVEEWLIRNLPPGDSSQLR